MKELPLDRISVGTIRRQGTSPAQEHALVVSKVSNGCSTRSSSVRQGGWHNMLAQPVGYGYLPEGNGGLGQHRVRTGHTLKQKPRSTEKTV
jgi:hypothetical protein